jgi:hypothetical protein
VCVVRCCIAIIALQFLGSISTHRVFLFSKNSLDKTRLKFLANTSITPELTKTHQVHDDHSILLAQWL